MKFYMKFSRYSHLPKCKFIISCPPAKINLRVLISSIRQVRPSSIRCKNVRFLHNYDSSIGNVFQQPDTPLHKISKSSLICLIYSSNKSSSWNTLYVFSSLIKNQEIYIWRIKKKMKRSSHFIDWFHFP